MTHTGKSHGCLRLRHPHQVVLSPSVRTEEDEEEYVLLDLDAVSGLVDIPPNAP
ncbi:hypothetical protein SLEP1_g57614 [Rubroshorea leprosula]|uniref:Uncharacterized protein n=1 Tax=Rubroshorea leprosula TaxID=152421 RepID=A0AAV5MRB7_9ROSI|nr:hypothetical protein SLEP1_g57614 [Rubroshorea leprosula]